MLNKKLILPLLSCFFAALAYGSNSKEYSQIYHVTVDIDQKVLLVKLCFDDAPNYLYATSQNAQKLTSHIQWNSKGSTSITTLKQDNGYIDLPNKQSGCLSYQVNTNKNSGRLNSSRFRQQHPHDNILSIGSWLWKRSDYDQASQNLIKFNHPKGINISAPWSLIKRTTNTTHYLSQYTPDDWAGYVAFGKFVVEDIQVYQSHLRLAFINGINHYNPKDMIDWVTQMSVAVANIIGRFPIDELQVMIILQKGNSGAVPWGQVNRGGGSAVLFVADPSSSHNRRIADWTAAHEFSHLLLPYTPYDRWLSEGFASYHQNITRARTGLLDEKTAWSKLLAGFERGRKASRQAGAKPLKSAGMRHLMQMYWGGAVIALKADVALQQISNGEQNLSLALAQLSQCCLNTRRDWNATETFKKLDEITETNVFMNLYYQEVQNKSYPDYLKLLNDLGIKKDQNGNITIDAKARLNSIRKRIIKG